MKPTTNLTTENIISILKECKGSVKRLKIAGNSIEVEFIEPQNSILETPSTQNQGITTTPPSQEIPPDKDLTKDLSEGKTSEEDEDERLLDELHLTNPSAFEDLIALREVKNAT